MTDVGNLSELIQAFSSLFTLLVAGSALNSWRNQLHGQFEFERANRLYEAVIALEETFYIARSRILEDSSHSRQNLANLYLAWGKFYSEARLLKRLWGSEFELSVNNLEQLLREYSSAVEDYHPLKKSLHDLRLDLDDLDEQSSLKLSLDEKQKYREQVTLMFQEYSERYARLKQVLEGIPTEINSFTEQLDKGFMSIASICFGKIQSIRSSPSI